MCAPEGCPTAPPLPDARCPLPSDFYNECKSGNHVQKMILDEKVTDRRLFDQSVITWTLVANSPHFRACPFQEWGR